MSLYVEDLQVSIMTINKISTCPGRKYLYVITKDSYNNYIGLSPIYCMKEAHSGQGHLI